MRRISLLVLSIWLAVVTASPSWRSRITGGSDAGEGQFPYQVSLRDLQLAHFCGGAILNSRWIITSASCVFGVNPSNLLVLTGSQSLTRGGTNHQVNRIVIHPNFSDIENDVAVVRLQTSIVLADNAFALRMASNFLEVAQGAVLSGWGRRSLESPAFPDWLQYVSTTVITQEDCRARYEPPYDERIVDSILCTSYPTSQGACLGDGGSPLVYGGELHGVVSWGTPCGNGHPDVHTRISKHRAWVLVHTMQ
ncbi:chymotrypsin-2-like [Sabethes cyaneus]|uniref:chymotrypsin-2-like n=1 Tax=Sabethes cyaneus TaxID=53552 RepID=UPI00237DED74|nr:chymotrypsin-2-like [Sabethes cyaneus]